MTRRTSRLLNQWTFLLLIAVPWSLVAGAIITFLGMVLGIMLWPMEGP